jgi:hypothetical protein
MNPSYKKKKVLKINSLLKKNLQFPKKKKQLRKVQVELIL